MMLDLEPPAARIREVLTDLPGDRLTDSTPCTEYTLRNLLEHLMGLTAAFVDAGRKDLGVRTDTDPSGPLPPLDPNWRTILPRRLDDLVATWRKPEAWEGMTQAGGVMLPAAVMGLVAQNELLVHGWDLSRSLGADYAVPTANLEASLGLLTPVPGGDNVSGAFGPAVDVPADSPLLDRVIALAGRDPAWAPTSR